MGKSRILSVILIVTLLVLSFAGMQATNAAGLEGLGIGDGVYSYINPGTESPRSMLYAYVKAGETLYVKNVAGYVREDLPGTFTITIFNDEVGGTAIYTQTSRTTEGADDFEFEWESSPEAVDRIWRVEHDGVMDTPGASIHIFNELHMYVKSSDGAKTTGRVWTNRLMLSQGGIVVVNGRPNYTPALSPLDNSLDISLWVISPNGYRYDVNLYQFNGIASNILFTSRGLVFASTGGSIDGSYPYLSDASENPVEYPQDEESLYKIFLDQPDYDNLPATVVPPIMTADEFGDFTEFVPDSADDTSRAGTFNYYINSTFYGTYTLELDLDGDGEYDGAADISIPGLVATGGDSNGTALKPLTYKWDGNDGEGNAVSEETTITARISTKEGNRLYITMSDVESMLGLSIRQTNGHDVGNTTLYWDDSEREENGVQLGFPEGIGYFNNTVDDVRPLNGEMTSAISSGPNGVDSSVQNGVHGWYWEKGQPVGSIEVAGTWGDFRLIQSWMISTFEADFKIEILGKTPPQPPTPQPPTPPTPTTPAMPTQLPNTGDNSVQLLWMPAVAVLAGAGIVIKKKHSNKKQRKIRQDNF